MMTWTREELVESITASNRRKEEYERQIAQELSYQENLYELLAQSLAKASAKAEMPQAFQ
jgi:hypothetical protein